MFLHCAECVCARAPAHVRVRALLHGAKPRTSYTLGSGWARRGKGAHHVVRVVQAPEAIHTAHGIVRWPATRSHRPVSRRLQTLLFALGQHSGRRACFPDTGFGLLPGMCSSAAAASFYAFQRRAGPHAFLTHQHRFRLKSPTAIMKSASVQHCGRGTLGEHE